MAGIPESHFVPWAAKLAKMGYRIARVDQLETAKSVLQKQANSARVRTQLIISLL